METNDESEPLLDGVNASSQMFDLPADVAALRARLLADTTQIVLGKSRRSRWKRIAGWGLAYAAGLATAWFTLHNWRQPEQTPAPQVAVIRPAPSPPEREVNPAPPEPMRRVTPELLRYRVATAPRERQIQLLKQAGDLYLRERNDLRSAVECYRQVLELSDRPEQLAVLPEDTWLLAELKNARQTP